MTGLDFSWAAVEAARKLAAETRADAAFVQSDVYLAVEGGRLFIREDHPVLLSAKVQNGFLTPQRPYFEQPEPNVAKSSATYVATHATFAQHPVVCPVRRNGDRFPVRESGTAKQPRCERCTVPPLTALSQTSEPTLGPGVLARCRGTVSSIHATAGSNIGHRPVVGGV
jgi:hypothetical protein